MPRAAVLTIGDELLNGAVVDGNGAYVCAALSDAGFDVVRKTTVGDRLEHIALEFRALASQSDVIVATGGLGPTSDDVTRHAAAMAKGAGLVLSEPALCKLEAYLSCKGFLMNENNKRQVFFPEGAEVITNSAGTADAFSVELPGPSDPALLFCLPGVPREMRLLVDEEVVPRCRARFPELSRYQARYLNCFGLGESHIGYVIEHAGLHPAISAAYRPHFPEILLTLTAAGKRPEAENDALLDEAAEKVLQALGPEFVVSRRQGEHLVDVVAAELSARSLTLAAAESCTGGLLSGEFTSRAGSSCFFLGGAVTYSNELKSSLLGVAPETLEKYGAVSRETALEMVRGVKAKTGAHLALSVTGVAGPEGGTADKPVGTVWIGASFPDLEEAFLYRLRWGRDFNRTYSVALAIDLVRRRLFGYPLQRERR